MYFPENKEIETHLKKVVDVFTLSSADIDSNSKKLESDEVLHIVSKELEKEGYLVEKSKKLEEKIRVPVSFGHNGTINLAFEADAYSSEYHTVIEVEAGRAYTNYQFLKDFYEAYMMHNIKYCCIAVRNIYRQSKDFEKVCNFFHTLYVSNRVQIPLEGILIIGY